MLPATCEDRAATGRRAEAEAALRATLEFFAAAGHAPRRPVRGLLERLAVPAFSESRSDAHVLHLQAAALGQPWLPGLLAREVAHMVLSDEGHPSHDPGLLQDGFEAARARSGDVRFLGLVGTLNHHIRDLYADALALRVAPRDAEAWLRWLAESPQDDSRGAEEAAVELAYVAAACARAGLALPGPVRARLDAVPGARGLADGLAALPADPDAETLQAALVALVGRVPLPAAV